MNKSKRICFYLIAFLIISTSLAGAQPKQSSLLWAQKNLPLLNVIQTTEGDLWGVGYFSDTLSVGRFTLVSKQARDVLLLHMDSECNVIRAYTFGGQGHDEGWQIDFAPDGGVIVGGRFSVDIEFGGESYTNNSGYGLFIAKLSSDGEEEWIKIINGVATNTHLKGFDVGPSGHVGLAGYTNGLVYFETDTVKAPFEGATTGFIAEFSPTGQELWVAKLYGGGLEQGNDITIDSFGNGYFTGMIAAETTIGSYSFKPKNLTDGLLAKIGVDGHVHWANRLGIGWWGRGQVLAISPDDQLYVSGEFVGSIELGGTNFTNDGTQEDVFIAKFDSSGKSVWGKVFGGSRIDGVNLLTMDDSTYIYIAGVFNTEMTLDDQVYSSRGPTDIYILKMLPEGEITHVDIIGGDATDYCRTMCTDSRGHVVFAGTIAENGYFNSDSITVERKIMIMRTGDPIVVNMELKPDNAGILFPEPGQHFYTAGDQITLEVDLFDGFQFDQWSSALVDHIGNSKNTHTIMNITENTTVTAVVTPPAIVQNTKSATSFELFPAYPNPFNPSTCISYSMPTRSVVCLKIYNIVGKKVATLVNKQQSAGLYTVFWNGIDDNGYIVPSGVYYSELNTTHGRLVNKLMLLK